MHFCQTTRPITKWGTLTIIKIPEKFPAGLEKYKLLYYISRHYEKFNRYNYRTAELALAVLTAGTPGVYLFAKITADTASAEIRFFVSEPPSGKMNPGRRFLIAEKTKHFI